MDGSFQRLQLAIEHTFAGTHAVSVSSKPSQNEKAPVRGVTGPMSAEASDAPSLGQFIS